MEFAILANDRLDRALRGLEFPGSVWMSRQAWEKALAEGRVRVAGRVERSGGKVVAAGATVHLDLPPLGLLPAATALAPHWLSPAGDWGVFLKDPGLASYPLMPWEKDSLAQRVAAFLVQEGRMAAEDFAKLAEPPVLEGGLLQRLDTDTSGIVSVAFNSEAKALYRKKFSGEAEKDYLALVSGAEGALGGMHSLWFPESSGPKVRAFASNAKGGRQAQLGVKVLAKNGDRALVCVTTSQGLRHVVRAGMAAIGFPLMGDGTYGGEGSAPFHQLHAWRLRVPGFLIPSAAPPASFLAMAQKAGLEFRE